MSEMSKIIIVMEPIYEEFQKKVNTLLMMSYAIKSSGFSEANGHWAHMVDRRYL